MQRPCRICAHELDLNTPVAAQVHRAVIISLRQNISDNVSVEFSRQKHIQEACTSYFRLLNIFRNIKTLRDISGYVPGIHLQRTSKPHSYTCRTISVSFMSWPLKYCIYVLHSQRLYSSGKRIIQPSYCPIHVYIPSLFISLVCSEPKIHAINQDSVEAMTYFLMLCSTYSLLYVHLLPACAVYSGICWRNLFCRDSY